jgi:hypothetical protein
MFSAKVEADQLENLFAHYLNSAAKARYLEEEFKLRADEISRRIRKLEIEADTSSRMLGGKQIHRLIRKLVRRHISKVKTDTRDVLLIINEQVLDLSAAWKDQYELEFAMERRARSAIIDQLAVVESVVLRLETIEKELIEIRQSLK